MGAAGRGLVCETWAADTMVRQIAEVYEDLLAARGHRGLAGQPRRAVEANT
jgi:hypothetical protein